MAFKREGDVGEWLDILKKRRVAELLGEDIPEDEVLLMKNGRLCCLVCHHRPTFDTLQVLQVHRSGKKHKSYAEQFYADKSEVHDLVRKRQHEEYVRTGKIHTVGPSEATQASGKAWLGCAPYDPRVKKHKAKPYQRKPAVQLGPADDTTGIEGTPQSSLPGYTHREEICSTKTPQTIAEYRQLQNRKATLGASLRPYVSKTSLKVQSWQQSSGETPLNHVNTTNQPSNTLSPVDGSTGSQEQSCSASLAGSEVWYVHKPRGHAKVKRKTVNVPDPPRNDERLQKAEKYLMARGSGWKKDWDGKWIKDEDAEFDSDEEPPDLP